MKKTEDIPPAELLLIASVDTELGPRQIRFYWGDLSTLIKEDSVVVISTSCFQPKITGIAWRRILARFPDIEKVEPTEVTKELEELGNNKKKKELKKNNNIVNQKSTMMIILNEIKQIFPLSIIISIIIFIMIFIYIMRF